MNTEQSKPQPAVLCTTHESLSFGWRVVYLTMAALFFVAGMIGVIVPGIPTTPFLLLTSFFLARSSPRLHRKFLANNLVGPTLRQWQENNSVDRRVKIMAIFMVVAAMLFVIFFSQLPRQLMVVVLGIACVGLFVVSSLPTAKQESI